MNGEKQCPCKRKKEKADKFRKYFNETCDNEYELLTDYVKNIEHVKVKHNSCGEVYLVTPKMWKRGRRCPICRGNNTKTTQEFKKEVQDLGKGDFELLGEYVNNRTKVEIEHKVCNKTFYMTPKDFLRGNRCPFCKQSKGERLVRDILEDLGVEYEIEKKFKGFTIYPFDFYLPKHHKLIEYDGEQHFISVPYFGGDTKLRDQKRRDAIKNKYTEEHNIELLRIPYYLSEEEVLITIQEFIKS